MAKICDFGLGRKIDDGSGAYYQIDGSGALPLRWMAPESVLYQRYSSESDMWSFGVVIWEILMDAELPFGDYDNFALAQCYGTSTIPPLVCKPTAPPVLAAIVHDAMQVVKESRPTFAAVWKQIRDARRALEGASDGEASDDGGAPPPVPASRRPMQDVGSGGGGGGSGGDGGGSRGGGSGRSSSSSSSSSSSKPVIKSGWITKKGGGTSAFGKMSWKMRWFVLRNDGTLSYYRSEKPGEKLLGSFKMSSVRGLHKMVFRGHARDCSFAVQTVDRMYAFVAATGQYYPASFLVNAMALMGCPPHPPNDGDGHLISVLSNLMLTCVRILTTSSLAIGGQRATWMTAIQNAIPE